MLPLRTHSATHPGLHHPKNEDAHSVLPTSEEGVLLVVCDGMGGMGRGDEASKLAIDVLSSEMSRTEVAPPDRMRNSLRLADQRIRDALCLAGEQPGSTAVMVYVLDGLAHVAWVGDSRAYLIRNGQVVYRTRDHKLVEEMVEAGQLTPDEARESAFAHVVTRALGGRSPEDAPVHPATLGYPWKLRFGDRIVLCSDGISDLLEDDDVCGLVDQASPADASARLVDAALMRGGHDNITCIVAVWDGPGAAEEESATPVMSTRRAGPNTPQPGEPRQTPGGGRPDDLIGAWDPAAADDLDRVSGDLDRELASRLETEELPFSDLPTAEMQKPGPSPAVAQLPPPIPDAAPGPWFAVGAFLLVAALVVAVLALTS
jgi:serine/threonine protein phosphatase PrpC